MGYLDQPLVVVALVALGAAAFWRLTRRAGSAEQMGPHGVDRMADHSMWSRFRGRARRGAMAEERTDRE